MSSSVTVRSIDVLEELQAGLIRYSDQAQATLAAIAREVQRTLEWLEARQRHWRAEVQRWRAEERRAWIAYQRCLSSGDRDHPPSCGCEEQALAEARRRLAQAEAEERVATQMRQAVQAAADAYAREATRLRATLQVETAKSVEVLRAKVTILRSYASGGVSAGAVVAGALAFGAGLALGAAASAGPREADVSQPPREPPLHELHPDIRDVPLDQIDLSDAPTLDFASRPRAAIADELAKLAQVRRWINEGATEQGLYDVDREARAAGMPEAQSHHNVYRTYYGADAIALEWAGDRYRVLNGYHRLTVARELGWTTIPARVVG